MNLLKRFKAWNKWRKRNLNSKLYKLSVLFGITKSFSFNIERWNDEVADAIKRGVQEVGDRNDMDSKL